MEGKNILNYLVIFLLFGGFLIFLYFAQGKITGFSVYEQSSQTNFDEGIYSNTFWNGSAIVLISGQTSGNYTSKIFDAGINSTWNDLSWTGNLPDVEYIFAIDNQADVWNSINSGINWSLTKDDYNAGEGNGVTASFYNNSKNYFIIYNQDIWTSNDYGISWTKINDDYNGAEGQNAYVAIADKSNNILAIEGDQDVWKSTDSGISWIKISDDFNGGNGNLFGLVSDSNNNLYAVDNQADIWSSVNSGINWSLTKDDYNAGAGNNADGMAIDSNNVLHVLDLQDVWSSNDLGVSWTKINDDFNGAGDSENGKSIVTDSNNNIYVIDGGEDVFKSTDSGATFVKIATNFNGANGIIPTMATIVRQTNLSFQTKVCFVSDCSDGVWQNVDLNNLNLYGRYFQYSVNFSTPDSGTTPGLGMVSIDYTINNSAPNLIISSPQSGSIYSKNNLSLNFSVLDLENNLDSCWYEFGNVNTSLLNCENITFIISGNGNYSLVVYANDSLNYLNSSNINFTISIPEVSSDSDAGSSGGSGSGGSSSSSKKSNLSATEVSAKNKTLNIQNFSSNLIDEQVELSLVNVDRRKGFVDVEYIVKNLANEDKNVNLYFSILDSNETLKFEIEEFHTLFANSENIFGTMIPVDKNLNEELVLVIDFKKYSSFVSEDAPIRRSISGFSVFNAEKNKTNLLVIVLSLLFFILVFIVLYRIIRNRKK
ncbi:MAG: hypothetical protein AABX44_02340 [Nanoarchaeota archaeon]